MRRVGVLVVSAAAMVLAMGAGAGARTTTTTVKIVGADSFVPNSKVASTFHYVPGTINVRSGSTATWKNQTADPHTVTVVAPNQVPTTVNQVFNCTVCGGNPSQNVGAPGLDSKGDSLFVKPNGSVSAVVSAKPGTTLHYICIFHPWMQGQIKVS